MGKNHCDRHGNVLRKAIEKSGLCLLNDGSVTFFRGYNYSSCLDLTLRPGDLANGIEWSTDAETWGSDHFRVLFRHRRVRRSLAWRSTKMTNYQALKFHMTQQADTISDVESLVSRIQNKIDLTSKMIPIPNGYAAVDSAYVLLRAIRRRGE